MQNVTISFIGAGNMARSLIGGLIASGFSAQHIWASNSSDIALTELKQEFAIHTSTDNKTVAAAGDVIVFCVKPKDLSTVCSELQTIITAKNVLLMSVVTGINTHRMNEWFGKAMPIVRTMPNTPALVQAGMTGLFATTEVSKQQHAWAEEIMRAVGAILWVDKEEKLDAITALSGSGPAYFLYFMEALADAGTQLGLPLEDTRLLIMQTALGSAKLAFESNENWDVLRKRITSPGGTTEQAINAFTPELAKLCEQAVNAAFQRAKELSKG